MSIVLTGRESAMILRQSEVQCSNEVGPVLSEMLSFVYIKKCRPNSWMNRPIEVVNYAVTVKLSF
jgi:hypothetical protein